MSMASYEPDRDWGDENAYDEHRKRLGTPENDFFGDSPPSVPEDDPGAFAPPLASADADKATSQGLPETEQDE